ncbi:MAG: acyltransferase family protein [Pyrinomonadaceae bacterium]
MHGFKANHIPALDGLRGLAILLVITHHQLIPVSLNGGFLGVDLFFVLSGFLITTLLLAEFASTNKISLKKFYARRALRLGPALLLYLTACLIVAYDTQILDWSRQLKLIGFAVAYSTNWRFAFGWDSVLDPTAIIWSLSIEEQFYILWPMIFFCCLMLKCKRRYLVLVLSGLILTIMVHRSSLLNEGVALNRLYYGTDTRADALLMGCLIALLPPWNPQQSAKRYVNFAATSAALCLAYLITTVHFTDHFLYGGGYTGIASMAGIVTWSVANAPPRVLTTVLEWAPLRWFGKISYGLYLWHWLLLKTTSFYFIAGSWDPWARFAVAVGVSALSFYLIERPFNQLKTRFASTPVQAALAQP